MFVVFLAFLFIAPVVIASEEVIMLDTTEINRLTVPISPALDYANNNEKDPTEQMCNVDHVADDINFTRYIIYESRILKDYSPKTLDNINRALVGSNNFDGKLLWNNIAFYNFIQRPMKTVDERPAWEDFLNGWRTFADVVKILKPTACIFIGNSAANFFNEAMAALGIVHNKVIGTKFINQTLAAITIESINEGIKSFHCSKYE